MLGGGLPGTEMAIGSLRGLPLVVDGLAGVREDVVG
jgi:hypothetical protein